MNNTSIPTTNPGSILSVKQVPFCCKIGNYYIEANIVDQEGFDYEVQDFEVYDGISRSTIMHHDIKHSEILEIYELHKETQNFVVDPYALSRSIPLDLSESSAEELISLSRLLHE